MNIIDQKGESHEVTGSGQGLYNTITGTIGALGAVSGNNGGGLLGGLFGGGKSGCSGCSENQPINRYDAQQMIALAAKDAEIAKLKSESDMKQNMVEVYTALATQDGKMRDRIEAMGKELLDKIVAEREARLLVEKDQAVVNQTMIGSTSTMAQQIKQLQGVLAEITTNVVPASKVCATGCCCGN